MPFPVEVKIKRLLQKVKGNWHCLGVRHVQEPHVEYHAGSTLSWF